jgi:hypothetical protein
MATEVCLDCGRPKGWHEVFCPQLRQFGRGTIIGVDVADPSLKKDAVVVIRKLPEIE